MTTEAMSVLLVEDDEVVRTSMCFALESAQIRVVEAGTVAEGLRHFLMHATDVVVIDLHLPDGSGYDLARWLWRQNAHLPMVMISTDIDGAGEAQVPAIHGRTVMLAKPFSATELLDAISLVTTSPEGIDRR